MNTAIVRGGPSKLKSLYHFLSTHPFLLAMILVMGQRLLLTAGSYLVGGSKENGSAYSVLIKNFIQWDSRFYVGIASNGYTSLKETAFFPLYPMAVKLLNILTGIPYEASGLIISTIALIFALYYLGLTIESIFNKSVAMATVILLITFPTALFFQVMYTESLFLAFSAIAVYHSRNTRFWYAGLFILFATLTRNTGIILSIIVLIDYMSHKDMGVRFWKQEWWKKIDSTICSLFIAPLGLILYMVWLKYNIGSYLAFVEAQQFWNRSFMPVWETYFSTFKLVLNPALDWQRKYFALQFLSLNVMLIALCIGFIYYRRYDVLGWCLYLGIVILITTTQPAYWESWPGGWDYLYSFPRFVLMMFPGFAFIAYASLKLRLQWLLACIIMISLGLQLKLGMVFFNGLWVA